MVHNISSLEYIEVNSELEALLLESRLIKKFKPFFNIAAKDDKSPYYIHITGEAYPRPEINHLAKGAVAGPFLNHLIPRRILLHLRHIASYCQAKRPVKKPCFYSHLGLCQPCPGISSDPDSQKAYLQNIRRLKNLLSGNFTRVKIQLQTSMDHYSKDLDYEKAARYRDYMNALSRLLETPVTPDEYLENPNLISDRRQMALNNLHLVLKPYFPQLVLHRMEMIDIAHLAGQSASGSLVVALDGQLTHRQYRHFNIRSAPTDSDVDMIAEVLERRLKRSDWPKPDLIVLDGGKPQLSVLSRKTYFINHESEIPIIALAKKFENLVIPVRDGYREISLPSNHHGLMLLEQLRDEAHRFSRRLHHLRRSKSLTA